MKINISFDTNNAAFDDNFYSEVDRVLRNANRMIQDANQRREFGPTFRYTLTDTNGNRVGEVLVA